MSGARPKLKSDNQKAKSATSYANHAGVHTVASCVVGAHNTVSHNRNSRTVMGLRSALMSRQFPVTSHSLTSAVASPPARESQSAEHVRARPFRNGIQSQSSDIVRHIAGHRCAAGGSGSRVARPTSTSHNISPNLSHTTYFPRRTAQCTQTILRHHMPSIVHRCSHPCI